MGGRGSASGISTVFQRDLGRLNNPETKADFVFKLDVISEIESATYKYYAKETDWENYGKSRTYFKINAYRRSDGEFHHSKDYGYFDNKSGKYVPNQYGDLSWKTLNAGGNSVTEKEILEAIKRVKKKIPQYD